MRDVVVPIIVGVLAVGLSLYMWQTQLDQLLSIAFSLIGGVSIGAGITLMITDHIERYAEGDKMYRLSEELKRIAVLETLAESRLEKEGDQEERRKIERSLEKLKRLRREIVLLLLISRLRQQTAPYYL